MPEGFRLTINQEKQLRDMREHEAFYEKRAQYERLAELIAEYRMIQQVPSAADRRKHLWVEIDKCLKIIKPKQSK